MPKPSAASRSAIALPMPRAAPVTKAERLGVMAGSRLRTRACSVLISTVLVSSRIRHHARLHKLCFGIHLTLVCDFSTDRWKPLAPLEMGRRAARRDRDHRLWANQACLVAPVMELNGPSEGGRGANP